MIINITSFSYFIGMGWLLMCKIIDYYERANGFVVTADTKDDYFITQFDIDGMSPDKQTNVAVYFAFTSLSTVGFGDFHPRSDVERLVGAAMLTFGVAIFSMVMS